MGWWVDLDMSNLVNEFDEITRWPKKQSDKQFIIEFLSTKFEFGAKYSEKDVNAIINRFHLFNDMALLRRELISRKYSLKNTIIFISPFLIFTCLWMVTNHPFQFVYFNKFAGNNIMNNFELDYSGTSNRSALSYIAKNDIRNEINLHIFSISPYQWSLLMIESEDRKRFKFTKNIDEANFIVTNHFYQKNSPNKVRQDLIKKYKLYKEFMVDGIPINSIYIRN